MKWLGIHRDLYNLRYGHIVAYLMEGVTAIEAQWGNSAAMALGDFLGCFVVVALFHTGALLFSRKPQA